MEVQVKTEPLAYAKVDEVTAVCRELPIRIIRFATILVDLPATLTASLTGMLVPIVVILLALYLGGIAYTTWF